MGLNLKFFVYDKAQLAESFTLRNAYLIGPDQNAIKADFEFKDGILACKKRDSGTAAISLMMPVGDLGELVVQTTLLPEREEPYLLNTELARHRLMVLYNKLEDWSMFELPEAHPVSRRLEVGSRLFIESLCQAPSDPAKAERLAREALICAIDGTEELALAHAEVLLNRRKDSSGIPRYPIGAGAPLSIDSEYAREGVKANFDLLCLNTPWRMLEPEKDEHRWEQMDDWAEWAARVRMPVIAGPLINFDPLSLPPWIYDWQDKYQQVRDFVYDHVERVVKRYRHVIAVWKIVSGLHVNRHFKFNFEQLIELTRLCAMLVKRVQPQGRVLVEITEPFGEYFATDQRSIPPLMYCDLLVQGAVAFDGFSLKLMMGQAVPGQFARDLMQFSSLLDQFAGYGKPVHVVAAIPSAPVTDAMIAVPDPSHEIDANCGYWRAPWSPVVQSHWLEAMCHIAFSRPYVESFTWHDMIDHPDAELPLSGLATEELVPRSGLRKIAQFRRTLTASGPGAFKISGQPATTTPTAQPAEAASPDAAPAPSAES